MNITLYCDNKPFIKDMPLRMPGGDTLYVETLKCYLSGFQLLGHDTLLWQEKNSFHLVDLLDTGRKSITLNKIPKKPFNTFRFQFGIDSTTHASGARGSDLDPTTGMYWTWQSGYIQFKLEGKAVKNKVSRPVTLHLGGYTGPFKAYQTVALPVRDHSSLELQFHLDQFITALESDKPLQIMSPGVAAVALSQKAASAFRLLQP